jgi:hypothetical protein
LTNTSIAGNSVPDTGSSSWNSGTVCAFQPLRARGIVEIQKKKIW